LSITIYRMCRNSLVGKLTGKFSLLSDRKCLLEVTPVSVSMLVYIKVALAEKSLASGRRSMSLKSSITEKEFLM
jgi:hypothetical protein